MRDLSLCALQPDLQQATMVEVNLLRIRLSEKDIELAEREKELEEIRDATGMQGASRDELIRYLWHQAEKEAGG